MGQDKGRAGQENTMQFECCCDQQESHHVFDVGEMFKVQIAEYLMLVVLPPVFIYAWQSGLHSALSFV